MGELQSLYGYLVCFVFKCVFVVPVEASLQYSGFKLKHMDLDILSQLIEKWRAMEDASQFKYLKKTSRCPDPCLAIYRPDICFGSVSETFDSIVDTYLSQLNVKQEFDTLSDTLDSDR